MKERERETLVHDCLVKNYEKYYRMVYSYTFKEQDAMDVVQEGAYRAILRCTSLKQPEYVDTWICRIMMNEAVRFLEKNRRCMINIEDVPEEGSEDRVADVDLKKAMEKLDDRERAIVVLRYFEEEKLETIGKMMDLNVNTVKSSLYRAVGKLKKYMENGGAEYEKVEKGI